MSSSPEFIRLSIGIFIIAGLLVSYLPQFKLLLLKKSTQGLSKYFLLLGFLGTISSLENVILLQLKSIENCGRVTGFECISTTMGVIQVLTQTTCFITLTILFMTYSYDAPVVRVMGIYATVVTIISVILIATETLKSEEYRQVISTTMILLL